MPCRNPIAPVKAGLPKPNLTLSSRLQGSTKRSLPNIVAVSVFIRNRSKPGARPPSPARTNDFLDRRHAHYWQYQHGVRHGWRLTGLLVPLAARQCSATRPAAGLHALRTGRQAQRRGMRGNFQHVQQRTLRQFAAESDRPDPGRPRPLPCFRIKPLSVLRWPGQPYRVGPAVRCPTAGAACRRWRADEKRQLQGKAGSLEHHRLAQPASRQ